MTLGGETAKLPRLKLEWVSEDLVPDIPGWLFDDAAAYEALRDKVATEAAALLAHGEGAKAATVLSTAYGVDAFHRADVDAIAGGIDAPVPQEGSRDG